jgi:hypothetical protein
VLRAQWDRTLGWASVALFFVLLVAGQQQLARSHSNAEQVAFFVSGGFGGLFVLFVGITFLLGADLRDTNHKLDRLERALQGAPAEQPTRRFSGAALGCGALWLVGAGFVTVGWLTAARTSDLGDALHGLAFGAIGVALATGGMVAYGVAGGLTRSRRMRAVLGGLAADSAGNDDGALAAGVGQTGWWSAAGLTRYHRPDCAALINAEGEPFRVEGASADLRPCLICQGEREGADGR